MCPLGLVVQHQPSGPVGAQGNTWAGRLGQVGPVGHVRSRGPSAVKG
jgi:hypothetical protein